MKFYYVTYIFDLKIFENEMSTLLNFFEIWTEMRFVSLFSLNERNCNLEKIVLPPYFVYDFSRKMFLVLYTIN